MSCNINRHAYTNFSGKPYIHYNSVPFNAQAKYIPQNGQQHRTIIRTNDQGNFAQHVPYNGMDKLFGATQIVDYPYNGDNWSNFVRKDNMYDRYAAKCQ